MGRFSKKSVVDSDWSEDITSGSSNNAENNRQEVINDLVSVVWENPKPVDTRYDRTYLDQKLALLREQAELYEYESNFVPAYYFSESGPIGKIAEMIHASVRELRKTILVILFVGRFWKNKWIIGEEEFEEFNQKNYDEIYSIVQGLEPGVQKKVLNNLLNKFSVEQGIITQDKIEDTPALIATFKAELANKKAQLQLCEEIKNDLCLPSELMLDPKDPSSEKLLQEYTKSYNRIFALELRTKRVVNTYEEYLDATEGLFVVKKELTKNSKLEGDTKAWIQSSFVFLNKNDPLLFALEEKKLEETIRDTIEPILRKRTEYEVVKISFENKKTKAIEKILDLQRRCFSVTEIKNWNDKSTIKYYCQIQPSNKAAEPEKRTYYKVELISSTGIREESLRIEISPVEYSTVFEQVKDLYSWKRDEIIKILTQESLQKEIDEIEHERLMTPIIGPQEDKGKSELILQRKLRALRYLDETWSLTLKNKKLIDAVSYEEDAIVIGGIPWAYDNLSAEQIDETAISPDIYKKNYNEKNRDKKSYIIRFDHKASDVFNYIALKKIDKNYPTLLPQVDDVLSSLSELPFANEVDNRVDINGDHVTILWRGWQLLKLLLWLDENISFYDGKAFRDYNSGYIWLAPLPEDSSASGSRVLSVRADWLGISSESRYTCVIRPLVRREDDA